MTEMMLIPVRISPSPASVLTLEEVKLHCRVDADEEDGLISGFVEGATEHLEDILAMKFVTQTWRQDFSAFSGCLRLPFRPVTASSIIIQYYDDANQVQTLAPSETQVLTDYQGTYITLSSGATWPSTFPRANAVFVTFDVGKPANEVDWRIKIAVGLLAGHWHRNREASSEKAMTDLPFGVDRMISSFRPIFL